MRQGVAGPGDQEGGSPWGRPSKYARGGQLYFHAQAGEQSIPEASRRPADAVLSELTGFPHWGHGFPEPKHELAEHHNLSSETRRKILHDRAERLYQRVAVGVST